MDSLPAYLRNLSRLGTHLAVIEQGSYRQRKISYAQLLQAAAAAQAEYQRRGIHSGEKLLLWGAAGANWAAAFYAAVLAGAVVVPVDAAFSAEYVERIALHTEARILVADQERRSRLAARLPQLQRLELETVFQLPSPAAPTGRELPPPSPETLLEIVYTSGATAEPKGVMITHGNLLANLRPIAREIEKYRLRARPFLPLRFLHLIPPSHLFGQVMALFVPPLLQSAVIYPESQSAAAWVDIVQENRASAVIAVPQQLQLFTQWAMGTLKAEGAGADDRRRRVLEKSRRHGILRRWWIWRRLHRRLGWKMWAFIVGGASLPPEEEELWQALGYAVIQGYGLTETAPAITITHPFKIRRGAVGRKLAGVEMKIAEDGEILVRGGNVSPGYFRNPAATAESFTDGWLHTGDLGELDAEGNLSLQGRKKEVIVTAEGLNVYPQDIEQLLDNQPEVRESAVVASEQGGRSQPYAIVLPAPGLDAPALGAAVERVNRRLEAHQRLRGFSLWPGERLPRTASTHKLKRTAIAAWLQQGESGRIGASQEEGWRGFFLNQLRLPSDRLRPEARLSEDLGLSSLDRAELLAWLEENGYMRLDEAELAEIRTLDELSQALASEQTPTAQAVAPATSTAAPMRSRGDAPWQGYQYPEWPASAWLRPLRTAMQYLAMFPALATVARLEIDGREHLRGVKRPVLFVANHQSLLDVPAILRALPARFRPWLAPAMSPDHFRDYFSPGASAWARLRAARRYRLTQTFFNSALLSDRIGVQRAIHFFGRLADRGYCPLIFPEGARTRDGGLLSFRGGIGMFIRALRLPVVPIRIYGLYEILPTGAEHARRGRARISLAAPLHLESESPASLTSELEAWYRRHFAPGSGGAGKT